MTEIARRLIQLDEVQPPVRRRVEVPLAMRLDNLHMVIQIAMGWENCHLYEFRVGRNIAYGVLDPDWDSPESGCLPANQASLADLLAQVTGKSKRFAYVYDFGDDWRHTVKVEAVLPAEAGEAYPRLVSAERACPPEDVGGPWGYADYLAALGDPAHERHDEMIRWRGAGFDPAMVDVPAVQKGLRSWGQRTARRETTKRTAATRKSV